MAEITLTGLASNDPIPGVYIETNFAAGPVAGDSSPLTMLVFANKLPSGSGIANTEVYGPGTKHPLQREADMIALAGAGSEAHRMFRRITRVNTQTTVNWVFVAESAGDAATGTIAVTGPATKRGSLRVWVQDEFVDVPFALAATATQIGDAIVAAVAGMPHWAVVATNATGTVTLAAKQKGPRGNFIRYAANVTAGEGVAVTPSVDTALSGGATSDTNATAINTVKARADYYLVSSAGDATQLAALMTYVDTQALPTNGNRKRIIAATVDTLANANALASGLNAARAEIYWQYKSLWTPAELAAHHAAIVALGELNTSSPRTNYCGYGNDAATQALYPVPAPRDESAWPDRDTDIKIALNNGLSPVAVGAANRCYLVDRITTRSLSGAVQDYRVRDAHKVTICDLFARDLAAKTALQHSGKRIKDDAKPGEKPSIPGPQVITPTLWRGTILGLIDAYDSNDLLQNVAETKAELLVQRESNPSTRMTARIPLAPIDNAKQFAAAIDQVA